MRSTTKHLYFSSVGIELAAKAKPSAWHAKKIKESDWLGILCDSCSHMVLSGIHGLGQWRPEHQWVGLPRPTSEGEYECDNTRLNKAGKLKCGQIFLAKNITQC